MLRTENYHEQVVAPRADKKPRRIANILIVDDDVDSALLIQSVFSHLGCPTTCSLTSSEAKKQICSHKADIIILDWVLDRQVDAKDVVRQCASIFAKFEHTEDHLLRPKIITYSGLDSSEISRLESPYFEHLDHWQKPMNHRELINRALILLEKMGS